LKDYIHLVTSNKSSAPLSLMPPTKLKKDLEKCDGKLLAAQQKGKGTLHQKLPSLPNHEG
jgi:hypothetical protein